MREMVGGCCVCSDEQGWNENPLVYCDGQGCTVAVHQACYGIVTVPTGPWYCRKCESQERAARVRCELCPNKDGALKRTDNGGWAHVVCALYIPEVRFGNVATMEPIILALVPQERFNKVCYLCLEKPGRESKASHGACMQCNKPGCKDAFHVTCAQSAGLLCEEAGNYMDNVKYCGYCEHHFQRINKKLVKTIPAFRPDPGPPAIEELSPAPSPDKLLSSGVSSLKDVSKYQSSCNSKGKGKRGRKPGSMIYEPKLEPPKFNPDLASLNSSNNSLNSVSNSVTLTPVSSFNNHKVVNNSFTNSDSLKIEKNLNDKVTNKNSNVVVKIGKHGEVHHAKKDSPHENLAGTVSPAESETILERVSAASGNLEIKEEIVDKKGFTTANFTESFIPASSLSVTASLIKTDSSEPLVDPSRVKVEAGAEGESGAVSLVTMPSHPQSGAQFKPDLKTNKPPGNGEKPTNSSCVSQMFSRNSLGSSVSLFPTGGGAGMSHSAQLQPHLTTAVSIIPSLTSNSSSSLSVSQMESTISSTSSPSSHGISMAKMANKLSEPVTISSLGSDNRLTLETLNQSKNGAMLSPKAKVSNGPAKRMGRPPKKGTHTTTSSLGNVIHIESEEEEAAAAAASKRARLEDLERGEAVAEKAESGGAGGGGSGGAGGSGGGLHKFMMFGATLNPASGMAKEMTTVLQNEVAAHSIYSGENSAQLVGVPLPGRRRTHDSGRSAPHTVAGMLDPARQPQTLEELLERHWEQGSRFLMEQASHFDIASLLSSLHQLKEENLGLEDSVDRLIARRDHLLAVRARLLALNSLTLGSFSQEGGRRVEPLPVQNGPSTERRPLVSPSRPLVSPSRDKSLPSPRAGPPLPSPRDRSPRLPAQMENGLEGPGGPGGPPVYRHERERLGAAQLLSVVQQHSNNSNHRQHSPVGMAGPPKAHNPHPPHPPHFPHNNLPPGHPARHGYPGNYQMVSPPPPKGPMVGPGHSSHSSHLSMAHRATPPGMRNTPPGHHGIMPEMHQHLIRAAPQSSIHIKK